MARKSQLIYKYYIARSNMSRRSRMLFISPAEVRFIQIMGGQVIIFPWIKHARTKFPLSYVKSLGKFMKKYDVEREVRVGSKFIDFGAEWLRRGIEIDGRDYHQDVIREQQRDDYVAEYGWTLLHIQARDLYTSPKFVRQKVVDFISKKLRNKHV